MRTMPPAPKAEEPQVSIPCAFCRGRGTDPFNVMSDLSVCSSCQGTGTVHVPRSHVRCAYCGGSGSYKTYRCPVCGGAGATGAVKGPTMICPECRGRGADGSSGLVCLHCHGHGVVTLRAEKHP